MKTIFKKHFLILLVLGIFHTYSIYAQGKLVEFAISSTSLNRNLKLMVGLPDGYNAANKNYPVLYVLHSYDKAMEEITGLSKKMYQDKSISEMIVVGIDEGKEGFNRFVDNAKYDAYLSCIEKEVIPTIEKQYRTNGQKIAYSKSLSGSLTLYALLTKPTLFHGYIAASKEWYEKSNDYFKELANKRLQSIDNFKGRKIFLATLNGAYNNNNIPEVDKQMAAFATLLTTKSGGNISAKYQAFDDWGLSPQPSLKEGLLFVGKSEAPTPTAPLSMTQTANGKWVIMDSKKMILYEVFIYDNGPDYASEGLIRVVKNGKIGYADAKTYAIVIAPQFDCAFPFENGKAKVSTKCKTVKEDEHSIWISDGWQYVDKNGKF
jgi:predicted alpha/beta superfamily hydrolase